ncbi:hypothetical protein PTKIN_Ptkin09bG0006000 [Pterospermum kingtungense]
MAKIISLIVLQAVFSFTFLQISYSDKNLIETTCKHTPLFNLCVSTLKPDPRSSNADVAGLAHIAADSVNAKATATLNQIKGLLKSAKDPNLQKALQHCLDSYNSIIEADIPVAIEAVVKGNPKFAVNSATDAAIEAQTCEKSFANYPPKSPISDSNKAVHDLCAVLESIASLLL